MSIIEAAIYSAFLGVTLVLFFVVPQFKFSKRRLKSVTETCAQRRAIHSSSMDDVSDGTSRILDEEKPTLLSSAWWIDEKLFQLERRAIFSKARNPLSMRRLTLLITSEDLGICHPCLEIPETWRLSYFRACRF
jgi:hypothetical protein